MSDVDDGLEGAQGLPNYIRIKPMTDPTADAARPKVEDAEVAVRNSVIKLRAEANATEELHQDDSEIAVMREAADLLERLAGYLSDMTAHFKDQAAKLAEREAELAQMQRERDGERETRERASDALMAKDEAIGVLIEIAGPQACQCAMDILDERRAARQQATKEKP